MGLLCVGAFTSMGSSLVPAALAMAAIASASVMIALTILAPCMLRLLAFWEMSPPWKIVCLDQRRWHGLEGTATCGEGSQAGTDWYNEREEVESTEMALSGGVPGSIMVEGVSSLSEGGGGMEMAGDRAEDRSGGLVTATLLK